MTQPLLKATEIWERELWKAAEPGDARQFLDWVRAVRATTATSTGVGALALLMAAGKFRFERTYYEQWFTHRDASVVTFSSGLVRAAG